eukprot:4288730-Prymnesium_polylepis.1
MVSLELKTSVGTGFFLNGDQAQQSSVDDPDPFGSGDANDRPFKRRNMSGRSSLEGSGDESRRAPNHLRKMFTEVCSAGQSSTKNLLFLAGFGGSPSATRRTTTVKTSPRGDSKGRKSSAVSRDLDATQK